MENNNTYETNTYYDIVGKRFFKYTREVRDDETGEFVCEYDFYFNEQAHAIYQQTKSDNPASFKDNLFKFKGEVSAKEYLKDLYKNHIAHKEFSSVSNFDKIRNDIKNLPESIANINIDLDFD